MRLTWVLVALVATSLAGCTDEPELEEESAPVEPVAELPMIIVEAEISTSGIFPLNPGLSPGQITVVRNSTLNVLYTNADPNQAVVHDLYFSGVDQQTPALSSGESAELSFIVDLPAGEYPFWCAIGSHREQGMEGVLIVTE